ncbi:transcription factor ABORTED MICROSPORES-like [Prosopis cineraria]|uniref:transcription factor ABORTED MICROSPORES-like n=1 Tax=Prosopis cineraria TaxID=364024 RepID=UPI00240E9DCD|nr:transcription factor ABORTED MICROSPORES-like [Prosopis cineraria]XP_054786338.1 transcription factor ABORTED MICROSPORES-like [Prosopis cineraria]
MNTVTQNLSEQLRPLVALNSWDYCVHWKLSKDRRSLFWTGCSCAGTESRQSGGDKLLSPVSSVASCRDTMFRHPRTESCALLSRLPVFITLDSGIHAETLLSKQCKWLNYTNSLDSNTSEKPVGTQVLIPVPGGLVELFATKQVLEDHHVIDFVTSRAAEKTASKNLEAEYMRRERLTKNLLSLRPLVPRISKPDSASLLDDTIEFVKDLQKQVKEQQDKLLQLEKISEMDEPPPAAADNVYGVEMGPKANQMKTQNGCIWKPKHEFDAPNHKQTQQMEAQVEVAVIKGNELKVKVLCGHRPGGFVKLMEAFHSLGLHVVRANVTTDQGLVSNIFRVQMKEKELVKAEEVRESLVELMSLSTAASQIEGARVSMLSLCILLLFLCLYDYYVHVPAIYKK